MYIMYMLTSARETGSCKISSFGTTHIILADVLSVIPVQTCVLDAQKNRLIGEYPRQVFVVKKPSYMSFTHSYLEVWLLFFVYFLQENIAMKTSDHRSSLFKILKSFL